MPLALIFPRSFGAWFSQGGVVIALLLLVSSTVRGADPVPAELAALVQRAQDLEAKGDFRTAIALYERALSTAAPANRTAFTQSFAALLHRALSARESPPAWRERLTQLYNVLIRDEAGPVRLQALNNYAALALQQEQFERAAELLTRARQDRGWEDLPRVHRARVEFKLGQALERSNPGAAFDHYLAAAADDPGFEQAWETALAQASGGETCDGNKVRRVLDQQLAFRDLSGVERSLRRVWLGPRRRGFTAESQLVVAWAEFLVVADVDQARFETEWTDGLALVRKRSDDPDTQRMLDDITKAYGAGHDVEFNPDIARDRWSVWRRAEVGPLWSRFLTTVALQEYRRGEFRRALGGFSQAWATDTSNMEAGLYAANILLLDQRNHAGISLDPGQKFFGSFVDQLFVEKGAEYRRPVGQDWNRLLKFHTILATIYEQREEWGSEDNVRSAIFQWRMALNAQTRFDPANTGVGWDRSRIQLRLATAFESAGRLDVAFTNALDAASGFLAVGESNAAEDALKQASLVAVKGEFGADRLRDVRQLAVRLEEMRRPNH